jgi:hypothetical protein
MEERKSYEKKDEGTKHRVTEERTDSQPAAAATLAIELAVDMFPPAVRLPFFPLALPPPSAFSLSYISLWLLATVRSTIDVPSRNRVRKRTFAC